MFLNQKGRHCPSNRENPHTALVPMVPPAYVSHLHACLPLEDKGLKPYLGFSPPPYCFIQINSTPPVHPTLDSNSWMQKTAESTAYPQRQVVSV